MNSDSHSKVAARHLCRNAYLYIRQSSLRQVFENTESTQRQYALKQRAVALGWPLERIIVVDSDQGQSGASAADREGFQRLVTEVSMGRAGIVMGLEVSRLARNSTDWHRLLEICALTDTLILDEDGIYDPAHFNDRLLLGLKGTMSEAELHILRARLVGGILNKAKRGELQSRLPIGLCYDEAGRVVLDPDQQVQQSLRVFFETFRRTGSAMATVKAFRAQHLRFPRRVNHGPNKGELLWGALDHSRALWLLHCPRYAGAFVYGRSKQRPQAVVGRYKKLPRQEWLSLIRDAHPGYLSWEEFEENQRQLLQNAAAEGEERRKSPPREGPALLQGVIVCGVCGLRMTVRYSQSKGQLVPEYVCQREGIRQGGPVCQRIPGTTLDAAVGQILVEAVTPMALEVTLAVQQELKSRLEEADALRHKAIERAQYEVELARRRYMRVDPDNRLVADSLEAEWNQRLREHQHAQEEYERLRQDDRLRMDPEQRARILELCTDVPALWNNPQTPHREKKRVLRLLIEDVTLRKGDELTLHIRFRGGATRTVVLPRPPNAWQLRQTRPEVIDQIDALMEEHTDAEIALILNAQGFVSGERKPFHPMRVYFLRTEYGLQSRFDRLRERGMLTLAEMAALLEVKPLTIRVWRRCGLLRAHAYNDRHDYLYEPPGPDAPRKHKWKVRKKSSEAQSKVTAHNAHEVQYEA